MYKEKLFYTIFVVNLKMDMMINLKFNKNIMIQIGNFNEEQQLLLLLEKEDYTQ